MSDPTQETRPEQAQRVRDYLNTHQHKSLYDAVLAFVDTVAERDAQIAALTQELDDARRLLRRQHPCVVCRWPRPADNEHNICECCGFQEGLDEPDAYEWDGRWWATNREYHEQPKILAAALSSEQTLRTALRDLIDAIPETTLTDDPSLRVWVNQSTAALQAPATEQP